MIDIPTVLILGAGASKPYGYPLASELRNNIISEFDKHVKAGRGWPYDLFDKDLISEFLYSLRSSRSYSIDEFISKQEDYTEIGKLAIAKHITSHESSKKLFSEKNEDDWMRYLIKYLHVSDFKNISENKINILTFNYDRSVEEYLFNTIWASYGGDSYNSCKSFLTDSILHLYGRVDPLVWEDSDHRHYGEPIKNYSWSIPEQEAGIKTKDYSYLLDISKGIKLIQEAKEDNTIKKANKLIDEAEKIYFLGLDLTNKTNLSLFNPKYFVGEKYVFTTTYGLEPAEIREIKRNFPTPLYCSDNDFKTLKSIKYYNPFTKPHKALSDRVRDNHSAY